MPAGLYGGASERTVEGIVAKLFRSQKALYSTYLVRLESVILPCAYSSDDRMNNVYLFIRYLHFRMRVVGQLANLLIITR